MPPIRCIIVLGPTATGKTRLAVEIARRFDGEIVSADSRQIYRGLDLGTGKDLAEYGSGAERVPLHLVDVVDPGEEYHLFRYLSDARKAIRGIVAGGRLPVIAGGTALYVNALLDDYEMEGGAPDPELRAELEKLSEEELTEMLQNEAPDIFARTDRSQHRRLVRAVEIARTRDGSNDAVEPLLDALLLAPYYPRSETHARIARRLDERLEEGMIDEVRGLHEAGTSWERLDWFGLEYRYVASYLKEELTLAEMREVLLARIRRFCKSQDVWFRKMERAGKTIHWLPGGKVEEAAELVSAFLAGEALPEPQLRLDDIRYGPKTS